MVLWRPTRPSRTNTPKDALFIIGDWNAKVGSQETPGVTGKFGLGLQNEAGQKLTEFCQENTLVIANRSSNNTRDDSTHSEKVKSLSSVRLFATPWTVAYQAPPSVGFSGQRYGSGLPFQMINTEIRLIIFFAAEDGEALYSQQKQDLELTMTQIISS